MNPVSRIHEIARAKGIILNFETAKVCGPAHLREFTMQCDWLDKSYKATANTKKRAIKTICTLIDADLGNLPDCEVDIGNSEYRTVCQTYGKTAATYLKNAANSVESGLRLKGNPPILEGTVPDKFNSRRYITMHVIACLVYDELKLDCEFANRDYITLMANQLRSRMSIKVSHQPDGNVTVSLKAYDQKETEQPTEFLFLVKL
nr:MAG: viral structural protein VP11 [Seadornavirus sp.]